MIPLLLKLISDQFEFCFKCRDKPYLGMSKYGAK